MLNQHGHSIPETVYRFGLFEAEASLRKHMGDQVMDAAKERVRRYFRDLGPKTYHRQVTFYDKPNNPVTDLQRAIMNGHLLDDLSDIDKPDALGYTPTHYAYHYNKDLIPELIKYGADMNFVSEHTRGIGSPMIWSPGSIIIRSRDRANTKLMIDCGVDMNDSRDPLSCYVFALFPDLFTSTMDLSARNSRNGFTGIHLGILWGLNHVLDYCTPAEAKQFRDEVKRALES